MSSRISSQPDCHFQDQIWFMASFPVFPPAAHSPFFFFFSFSMVHLLNVELETQLEFTQVYNVWILNLQNNKNSCPNLSYLGCLFSWWAQPSSLTEWIKRSTRFDQLRAMMVWIIPKFPSTAKRPASTKAEQRYSFGILYTLMYDTVKEIGEVPNRRGGAVSCGP